MTITLNGTTGITSTGITETSDGNVGIGTSSHYDASTKLTVAGRINTSNGTAIGSMNYGGGAVVNIGSLSNHPVQLMTNNTTRVAIDSAGRVTMPYQPVFSARLSSNQTVNSGQAILQFASTDINQGSHFNTSTYRFTAPVAGKYYLNLRQYCNPASGSYVGVYITGTPGTRYAFSPVGNDVSVDLTWIAYLAAGDYVEGYYYNNGTLTARPDGTAFEGFLIG